MSIRTLVFTAAALAAICAPAIADDPPPATAANSEPAVGDRVRVKLRSGRSVEGVVLVKGTWERRDAGTGWTSASRNEKGAGIRLWWTNDLDGFQFVVEREVLEMRTLGAMTPEDSKELAKRRTEAAERTAKERKKQEKEAAKVEDATAQAKSLVAEVEKAKAEGQIAALAEAKRKADESKAKRWAELLAKYPPDKWSADLPKEIERRKTTLHLFPSEDEVAFLKVYTEWREAVEAWKAAQALAKGVKGAK